MEETVGGEEEPSGKTLFRGDIDEPLSPVPGPTRGLAAAGEEISVFRTVLASFNGSALCPSDVCLRRKKLG